MRPAFCLFIAALPLAACGNAGSNGQTALPGQNLIAAITPAAQPAPPPASPQPAPQPAPGSFEAQLQAEAQSVQSMLPMQVDRVTQITAVRVEGTEVVYTLRYAVPIPDVERVRREAQAHAQTSVCANAPAAALVRRGATMRYDYTDNIGVTFNTRVTACP